MALRKSIYLEQIKEEAQIIDSIREIALQPQFLRSLNNGGSPKEIIDHFISELNSGSLEVAASKEKLKKKHNDFIEIIKQQKKAETLKLKQIKSEIGNKMWDEVKEYITSEEFLDMLFSKGTSC